MRGDRLAIGAVLLGGAGCALGWVLTPLALYTGWLAGFDFWLGAVLACLAWPMILRLSGGSRWGAALASAFRTVAASLPLFLVLLLPLLLGMARLYPWVTAPTANHWYLNPAFFVVRALFALALWIGLLLLWRGTTDGPRAGAIAAAGLILLTLTATFTAIDWTMSLEPAWSSSIYGMQAITGHLLAGLALAILWTPPQPAEINRDLGTLLLALVLVWAYLAFMQFLIVYSENLPQEIPWYLKRMAGGWGALGLALVVAHVALPFFVLLIAALKRRAGIIRGMALLLFLSQLAHELWLVLPEHPALSLIWIAPAAMLLIGATVLAWVRADVPLPVPRRVAEGRHG